MIVRLLIKLISFLKKLLPIHRINNHKYLNKNQVTNLKIVINSLKNRGYYPTYIYDIGCFNGQWTKQILNIYDKSNFFLFDANSENESHLNKLQKKFSNIQYKIALLSDDINEYNFFKMKSGSSIFEEQTTYPRELQILSSTTLSSYITPNIKDSYNNMIKIDAQGS
jgi:FkbM family methyltransferase